MLHPAFLPAVPFGPEKLPLPVPPELLALGLTKKTTPILSPRQKTAATLLPQTLDRSAATPPAFGQPVSGVSTASVPPPASSASLAEHPPAPSQRPATPLLPSYEQDVRQWNCSHQQRTWVKTEMEALGLWPGSRPGLLCCI
ncbi:hypothetical protein CHARACLAT_030750 [Characodon lateralis]|uniref:Uncharacterized protein n=1 Tax=Characodon lateralis TaxID=208331 RepID=A0ABU7D205_9TELE|nr:hypothetical protein [Characodon lateralis]